MPESEILTPIISRVLLPDGTSVNPRGLIVVVGPNSSGKTSLLRELHAAASGVPRELVVAERISFSPAPPLQSLLDHLVSTGDMERIARPQQALVYQRKGHQYGTQQGHGGQWDFSVLERWHEAYQAYVEQGAVVKSVTPQDFLANVGTLLSSALFIEQRFLLTQKVPSFDTWSAIPNSALQALRINLTAERQLSEEVSKVFRRGLWVDKSGAAQLQFLVCDTASAPTPDEQNDPHLMKRFRGIDTEGEGLRSYVAICMTLLLGQRPLCFIDEPEMCLHPPQARALGRFIAKFGKSKSACTLIATHSSDILRGMLETDSSITVIRLVREQNKFRARALEATLLRSCTRKPLSRSEPILAGLFVDGVVLCESDGDRAVYESTLRSLPPPLPDIRFVPVGGTGGFREPRRLYQRIGVPVAIAADFDFLLKSEIENLLSDSGADHARIGQELSQLITECREGLMAPKPEASAEAVVAELEKLAENLREKPCEPLTQDQLTSLGDDLRQLAKRLSPADRLKATGLGGLEAGDFKTKVTSLLEKLKLHGIFLVPTGELESWCKHLMQGGPSKRDKGAWATEASKRIEDQGYTHEDVWLYVEEIVNYLKPIP